MAEIDTVTIPELPTGTLTADSLIPFSLPGGDMQKTKASDVAALVTVSAPPVFSNSSDFQI